MGKKTPTKVIKNRKFTVRDLITVLNELDPDTEVMVNAAFGGLYTRPVLVAKEGGAPRPSFDGKLLCWAVKKVGKDADDKLVYFEIKKSLRTKDSAPKGFTKILGIG